MKVALIGLQLAIDDDVLASPDAYREHLEAEVERALDAAEERAGEVDARVVVLPEMAGHVGLLALAPPLARKAKTLGAALAASAARRPLEVLRGVATGSLLEPRHAVLSAIAPDGERYWRGIFGPLARRTATYLVAGSHLRLGAAGDLTNASFLFGPDGRLLATTDKVNLLPGVEDRAPRALGLGRGAAERVPIIDTPLGRVCTLIGYDGFVTPHTTEERFEVMAARIAERGGVTLVANPAANPWRWHGPWPPERFAGQTRDDVAPWREDQWDREGLPASLAVTRVARWGVTSHLVGRVLDLSFDGQSEILERGEDGVRRLARAERPDRGEHVIAVVTC